MPSCQLTAGSLMGVGAGRGVARVGNWDDTAPRHGRQRPRGHEPEVRGRRPEVSGEKLRDGNGPQVPFFLTSDLRRRAADLRMPLPPAGVSDRLAPDTRIRAP